MTSDDLVNKKGDLLSSVPDDFASGTVKAEKTAYQLFQDEIASLDIKNGKIVNSRNNLAKINKMADRLNQIIFEDTNFTKELTTFVKSIATIADINNKYYASTFDEFKPEPLYEDVVKNSQETAFKLFDSSAVETVLTDPVKQVIQNNMVSEASLSDTLYSVRTFIEGAGEAPGKLSRYVGQYAHDYYANADAAYSNTINTALDIQWFLYSGGLLKDSRSFCKKRAGNYYCKAEIESWASEEWDGKNPSTNKSNIFILRGGFHCEHVIAAVSESVVPKDVIEKARKEGFIK